MPALQQPAASLPRQAFLDRLRVMLTGLVILHHTAIMHGADGGWFLRFPTDDKGARVLLTMMCAVDQAFFMGLFFLLAGHFTPSALQRKGAVGFLKDRLLRLGLPLLAFGLLLGPFTASLAGMAAPGHAGLSQVLAQTWARLLAGEVNLGPLWFAYALLLFSVAYVLLRPWLARIGARLAGVRPGHGGLVALVLAWGAGAFLLRQWVPTGQEVGRLQLGFFASYALLFVVGTWSAPGRWLEQVDGPLARPWAWLSLASVPTLLIYAVLAGALQGQPFNVRGGFSWPVLFYAFWEPLVAVGIILMLLWRLRVSASPWPVWDRLAPSAYAAFVVHAPVVVAMGLWLQPLAWGPLAKFAVSGTLGVVLSFALGWALRRLPGVGRVL